jgi:WD40 repeat protein
VRHSLSLTDTRRHVKRTRRSQVWSGEDGTFQRRLSRHSGTVWALAIGKDGTVISGSETGTVRAWSPIDGAFIGLIFFHQNVNDDPLFGEEENVDAPV